MYITITYRSVCRKIQRCIRFKYLKLRKTNFESNKIVYSTTPLVSDIITDQFTSDGKVNIIQFTESHSESGLFTYFLYKFWVFFLIQRNIMQHLD